MKNSFLIIRFGDNDFSGTLESLGKYLLSGKFRACKSTIDVLEEINNTDDLGNVITLIFRSLLSLNQHRFDLYGLYNNYESLTEKNNFYMNDDYFKLNPVFSESYEKDCNGECLVIDLKNNVSFVV